MKVIILAGGGGTRLFPLSRTCFPKQFLKVGNEKSLLAQTVSRFLNLVKAEDILVVTNKEYVHHVKNELAICNAVNAHIILEPIGRNTAPAIALAVKYCIDELSCNDKEVFAVTPADHVIKNVDLFNKCIKKGATLAEMNKLATFGIKPDKPEIGYGYIETGDKFGDGFIVKSFKEKPELAVAKQYVAAGNYYWNSGMFIANIGFMVGEFAKHQNDIYEQMQKPYAVIVNDFAEMPSISIDYAIAEKSDAVVTVPLDCYWNDIGSWDAIYDVYDKDDKGNAIKGDCITIDCNNSLLLGRDRLIAGIGLEDVLVVETDDVIVVAKKGESQKVKNLVDELKVRNRKEASEHTTMYRPWGSYTVLGEGQGYKMKKISVSPKERLSLQLHYHRSEHWIVTQGTAKVTIGETEMIVQENESVFVPVATKHRLENPGLIPLEIIEVQNGSYLEEDDIVRFDDEYGRQ